MYRNNNSNSNSIYKYYLLLLVVGVIISNVDAQDSSLVAKPYIETEKDIKGVENYALSGKCTPSFVIQGKMDKSNEINTCRLDGTPSLQSSVCQLQIIVTNTTDFIFLFSWVIPSNSVQYTSISLTLIRSDSTSNIFNLVNENGQEFKYHCLDQPSVSQPFISNTPLQFKKSSHSFTTYLFYSFFTLDSAYTKLINNVYCTFDGIFCDFYYINENVIMIFFRFLEVSTVPILGTSIKISTDTINEYFISSPLNSDYNSLTLSLPTKISFKNSPYNGYYFGIHLTGGSSTDASLFPPIILNLTPLDGNNLKEMNFYMIILSQHHPKMIINNTLEDFYQPLSQDPKSISPELIFIQKTGYVVNSFTTNQRWASIHNSFHEYQYSYYPYGFWGTDLMTLKRIYRTVLPVNPSLLNYSYYIFIPDQFEIGSSLTPSEPQDTTKPTFTSWDFNRLNQTHSVLHIGVEDDLSGIDFIVVASHIHRYYITRNHLVTGTITNGIYEIIVPYRKSMFVEIGVSDNAGNMALFPYTFKLNLNSHYQLGLALLDLTLASMVDVLEFNPSMVDVSSSKQDVVLSLQLSQELKEDDTTVFLELHFNPNINNPIIQGVYDTDTGSYLFPFTVPAKLMPGVLDYALIINGQPRVEYWKLYNLGQLEIVNTENIDMLAPIVVSISAAQPLTWTIGFSDSTGLRKVVVGISSDYDVQGQNFTKTLNGEITYEGVFQVPITVNDCRKMNYWISYIYTEDVLGNSAESVRYSNNKMHPFFKFDDLTIDILSSAPLGCIDPTDTSPPALQDLTIESIIDDSVPNEQVLVKFSITDISGISDAHIPVCFFSGQGNELLKSIAVIDTQSINNVNYKCNFTFPFRFGPYAYLSIYGISDKYFNTIGFTSFDIDSLGFNYKYTITQLNTLAIESTSSLELSSAELYIYGYGFSYHEGCVVEVQMDLDNVTITPTLSFGSVLLLNNLKESYKYTINVYSPVSNERSNLVTLKGPLSTPLTPTPTPPQTDPPVTNPPLLCNSDCGLPQGYGKCVNGVCVCNALQAGLDCKSIVDTTPITKPDPTKPSVNVTIPGSNTIESPQFTSFVSVIAIQELDPLNNNNIISSHQFNNDKWIIVPEGSSTNDIVSSIQYKYLVDNSLNTTITSTVQVFSKASNITFGNQQLYMNPSTIKFTFNITSYPFSKSTNTLQLIMTAALESSDKVACSYKEFVDDQSNSEYLKIQIQDRSLFGRFIKFGIVDGRPDIITNTILDNSYGGKQLSQSTSDQSYIGLNIRYYTQYVLIDPDFSVLIESRSAKDQQNSICTNESSKKLTNGQIAGIVVGSAVFLFIIVFTILYIFTRKSASPIALKLRRIGK